MSRAANIRLCVVDIARLNARSFIYPTSVHSLFRNQIICINIPQLSEVLLFFRFHNHILFSYIGGSIVIHSTSRDTIFTYFRLCFKASASARCLANSCSNASWSHPTKPPTFSPFLKTVKEGVSVTPSSSTSSGIPALFSLRILKLLFAASSECLPSCCKSVALCKSRTLSLRTYLTRIGAIVLQSAESKEKQSTIATQFLSFSR